eukprot:TRINITY_DN7429_c0_g1_i1.p1 TRINITY_DN7429_c0_g1~~TRINITY_DN7429_c0_g1_i1.p1  ORF type:complete len:529 (-),score=145.11 TRINITY_DN7429_c0_g1_i1:141-1727(-)
MLCVRVDLNSKVSVHRGQGSNKNTFKRDHSTNNISISAPISLQGQNPSEQWLLPPIKDELKGRKTLVLDLDETLIHSSFQEIPNADFLIPVTANGRSLCVYVKKRPGVESFLAEMSGYYEIAVYTASQAIYATPILDQLDPERLIHHRLFRESCIVTNGGFIKDLSKLGRDLAGVVIVDNSPACYALQPENGIPISTWMEDPNDLMLSQLAPFLKLLATVEDVREYLMWLITDDNIDYIDALSELKSSLENKSEDSIQDDKFNEELPKTQSPAKKESSNTPIEILQAPAVSKPSCHIRNGSCNFDTNKKFVTLATPCHISGVKTKRVKMPARATATEGLQIPVSAQNKRKLGGAVKTEVSTPRNRVVNANILTLQDPKKNNQVALRNSEAIERHIKKIKSKVTSPKAARPTTTRLSLNSNKELNAPQSERLKIKLDISSLENKIVSINLTKSSAKKPLTARRDNRGNVSREIAMKCIPREVVNISRGHISTSAKSLKKIVALKATVPGNQKKPLASRKHIVAAPELII